MFDRATTGLTSLYHQSPIGHRCAASGNQFSGTETRRTEECAAMWASSSSGRFNALQIACMPWQLASLPQVTGT